MNDEVDWTDPPLQRWINEIQRDSTRTYYKTVWRTFAKYTKKTGTQLLREASEDMKKSPEDRKGVVLQRLLGFYQWLVNEYPVVQKVKGGEREVIRTGMRPKSAYTSVQVVRSFYGTFEINIKMRGKSRLPRPRVYNKRMNLSTLEIKLLCDQARYPRDRAIILTLFQGGLDSATVCSIKYEDVKNGLANEEHPLKLELFREKAGVEYYTFLGKDAVGAIKAYLNDLKARGVGLRNNDSLFVKTLNSPRPQKMTTNLIQKILRDAAMRSGLVDSNLNGKDMNPVSPHALREAFGSIMVNKGVPDTIVDFWLGHTLGEMAQAYKGVKEEELKRMYLEREQYISISAPESGKYEEEIGGLQTQVNSLLAENLRLKDEVARMKGDVNTLKDWMPDLKEVIDWHKEIKIEKQLEEESMKFHPYPDKDWRERRRKELTGK